MSRIIDGETSGGCKTWQAPDLNNIHTNNGSGLTGHQSMSGQEQQEELSREAYEEIYQKAFEEGYRDGLSRGENEVNARLQSLQSLMAQLAMPLPELDNQVVEELVQLCMSMVKQMVRRELKMSPDEIVAIVRDALNLLPDSAAEVTLELHPEDARLIRDAFARPEVEPRWVIMEDPLLTRGGCRVTTTTSRIDATVEKRINSVIAEVMGSDRKVDSL